MVIQSRFSAQVPNCSIQTWIFGSCSGPLHHGDSKAWIDADNPEDRFFTYYSARLLAKRIAVGLIDAGLEHGDRVLVISDNSIVYPPIILGIWMAGGIFTGANSGLSTRELTFQLRDSQAQFLLAAASCWNFALEAANLVRLPLEKVYLVDGMLPGLGIQESIPQQHWARLWAPVERAGAFEWVEPADARETTCTLNYSSGTTGLPKGVEITHYNHVANGSGVVQLDKLAPDYDAKTRRAAALCFLPMYHAFSQGYFISCFPHQRVPVFIMPSFDLVKMLSHICKFQITKLFAVPPVLILLSKHPLARGANLSSLKMVTSGAAPLASDTQTEVSKLMPEGYQSMVRQGWGMTEVTCTALGWDPTTNTAVAGVGELMPGCKARLVDLETGEEILEPGIQGELYISTPTLMKGYWRNPDATRYVVTTDGAGSRWLRTGDIAYVGPRYEDGSLFHIVDRAKELIKVRGFQVSPSELGALLLERADVLDAAVIGILVNGEELPRAYVVAKPGHKHATETEIQDWVAQRVAHYKRLKGGVAFVDAIPKTPAGKILRKVLKDRARLEMDGASARL